MKSLVVQRMKTCWAAAVLALLFGVSAASAQEHRGFASAEEAVTSMVGVLEREDRTELGPILGPGSTGIVDSGDAVADAEALADFLERFKAKHALVADGEGQMILQVGENDWPLPIPLVEREGKWYFDGAAGAQEIVYRRVGRNELGAIAVCRGFIDAQTEYASQGHDGNAPGVYAAKLLSDPGQQNGLYWPTAEGEPQSPAGPAVADAAEEGYRAIKGTRTPYHGYYYRMLFAQGANAGGGAMEYFVEGLLTQGIALLAWPAEYGVSGVKSFVINQDGVVYEKDLGEETATVAQRIQVFDPDSSWSIVEPDDAS